MQGDSTTRASWKSYCRKNLIHCCMCEVWWMDALIWSKQLQHRGLCDCVQLEHSSFWVNPCDGCHVTGAGRCNTEHWMKRSQLSKVLQNISGWCQVMTLHVWSLCWTKVSCSKAFQEPATHHYRPPIPSCIRQVRHLISGTPLSEMVLALTSTDFA